MAEGKLSRASIEFYDFTNHLAKRIYMQLRSIDYSTPKNEAIKNLDQFVQRISFEIDNDSKKVLFNSKNLEDKLDDYGLSYVSREEINKLSSDKAQKYLKTYDKLGLIPRNDEDLKDYIYRANTQLILHKIFRNFGLRPVLKMDKDFDTSIGHIEGYSSIIPIEDIMEANKKIPYGMDLSWISAFTNDDNNFLKGAYGVCVTLPKYYGLSYLSIRGTFKSRENYLKVLSHEMSHFGTVFLDSRRDFLETKAYAAGSAAFGEHTISINQKPSIIQNIIKYGFEGILRIQLPKFLFSTIPKVKSAIEIADNKSVFKECQKNLINAYGDAAGNYILGRLTADEIEEFAYTNNVPKRLAKKKGLKWKIVKEKIEYPF